MGTAINLIINGNATASVNNNNFIVKFLDEEGNRPSIEGSPTNTISVDSDTIASFNISILAAKDDSIIATLKLKNASSGVGALIGLDLTSSNTEYFKVTETILDNTLQAEEREVYNANVAELKRAFLDWETTCTDYTAT